MGVDISFHIEIEVYNVRYYHFEDLLDDAGSHIRGKKDFLSHELQILLDDKGTRM